jgi:hypothetical protein
VIDLLDLLEFVKRAQTGESSIQPKGNPTYEGHFITKGGKPPVPPRLNKSAPSLPPKSSSVQWKTITGLSREEVVEDLCFSPL